MRSALFPAEGTPTTFAHVAEVDGAVVGMAVWFLTFSTWTGRNGIWLEDLYVDPAHRGERPRYGAARRAGAGSAATGATVAWSGGVLNWNTPSIGFYESIGAVAQTEWTTYRLDGDALAALATAGETS